MARLPDYRVATDPGTAARTLHTLEQRARHGLPGLSAIAEHEMAHSIYEAAALLTGDDDRRLAAVARMSDPFARLSLMLGLVRRALTGLLHALLTAAESLLARAAGARRGMATEAPTSASQPRVGGSDGSTYVPAR
jgi:inorganic triphosphatase YgiF